MKLFQKRPVSDIERQLYEKKIKELTYERDDYANKYEASKKYEKEYIQLSEEFKERRKEQEKLIKYTQDLIKEISNLKNKLDK